MLGLPVSAPVYTANKDLHPYCSRLHACPDTVGTGSNTGGMMRLSLIIGVSLLAGCATTWENPRYTSDAQVQQQFAGDNRQCELYAAGSAPMPNVYAPEPATRTTYVQGDMRNRYGERVGGYSGTATTYNPNAFGSGFASGMSYGNAAAARRIQGMAYKQCMNHLGWDKAGRDWW